MGAFCAKRLVSAGLLKELVRRLLIHSSLLLTHRPQGNMRCLDMNRAEPAIVNGTREVCPGLILTGTSLCSSLNSPADDEC
jgi:thiamine thiazole synthase